MKKTVLCIGKIVLSVATLPLWFIKMFVGIGHLPDQSTGEIVEVVFRHSMFENISDISHPVFSYISMAIAAISAVVNILVLKSPDHKKANAVANITFAVALGVFGVLLLLASSVARGY